MLSVEYQPQNYYCYSIDAKASRIFKSQIRNLGKCFTNIFIPNKEYFVYSNGKNVTRSHLSCIYLLNLLTENNKTRIDWKYIILLQV